MPGHKLLPERLRRWLPLARIAEQLFGIEPLLVLAVMDRESLGGEALQPRGPTGSGDKGHGRGLMQIDDRAHPTLAAAMLPSGKPLLGQAVFNILIAAEYLHDLVLAFDGFGCDPVPCAVAAYNCGPAKVRKALRDVKKPLVGADLLARLDPLTAGGNYVSDVLERRRKFVLST
jgi:soluble lytic murein transglycosylase-like protein